MSTSEPGANESRPRDQRPRWPAGPDACCIHQVVAAQASISPAKTAVTCGETSITYAELEARSNALAGALVDRGVTPETLVAICAERSVEMIVAILGVLKSGGAYVPIDPAYPKERVQFLLEDSGCRLLLTQAHLRDRLPQHRAEVLCIEDHLSRESTPAPSVQCHPEQLAYVIYTSGSTGKPKGTCITHRSLVYSTKERFDVYERPLESYLLLSSFAFDSSVAGIFWTLTAGGRLVLVSEGVQQDPMRLCELIARERISHLLCLPSFYASLLDVRRGAVPAPSAVGEARGVETSGERRSSTIAADNLTADGGETPPRREAGDTPALRSLNTVIVAGEACGAELVARHHQLLPETELYNEYGPTEATVWSSVYHCKRGEKLDVVPIGKPIATTEMVLLADAPIGSEKIICATGETGEIYIGGEGLARGYLNRRELTAERFVAHPFKKGARLYRTGDLARWLPSGDLEFIGRVDQQVKIRGYRIELGEIEAALMAHESVREAAVIARPFNRRGAVSAPSAVGETHGVEINAERRSSADVAHHPTADGGGTPPRRTDELRLIAYIVPHSGKKPTVSALRELLSARLPEYMLPSAFMLLDDFPRTPNGKVDKKALPEPSRKRPELATPYAAPRNAVEEYICNLWCELLELDQVGIHDTFFELGGTSLKGASFIARVQQDIGEFIYIVKLFESPTVAGFAEFLARDYPAAVAMKFGQTLLAVPAAPVKHRRIDRAMIEQMRRSIPTLPEERRGAVSAPSAVGEARGAETENRETYSLNGAHSPTADGGGTPPRRNRRAIFILSPPRSGTTLLRVMLAGHPELFSATELQLLGFNTLLERRRAFSGKYSLWLEGTLRALMEIERIDADGAKARMAEYEAQNLTTREFYALLQQWIAPRTLVDKSPSYVFDLETLKKAERDFDGALYIHLVRHPYAMVRSFEKLHMDQALYLYEHGFTARELGELLWIISHENTIEFLKSVPRERQFRMRFEDLTASPRETLMSMCASLSLEFHEEMAQPYKDVDRKMTDGLYAQSTPMGDEKFLKHGEIKQSVAEQWKEVLKDDFLSEITWELALSLGYERPCAVQQTPATMARLAQQRRLRAKNRV
ncbi:MAG TPA: AMP-binding protein [Planctomycetota bacterium]|nr:AMP-binding protein [Planctomycetota bacterium]